MKQVLIALVCVLSAALCRADSIMLNDGSSLTGTVLAEKESQLVVDLGFTVLLVPKDRIVERFTKSADANAPAIEAVADDSAPVFKPAIVDNVALSQIGLYYTGVCKKTSIEDCVERFSEAVVMVSTPSGLGSGFFINDEGYLITNYHVIEQETRIEVTVFQKNRTGFEKKRFKHVRIEALNPFVDLAMLKIEDMDGYKTKFVTMGSMESLKVGEPVFAIGNPLGLERSTTAGIVSTKSRGFEGLAYIQTNADINPGNSGGPLFNLAGEVVGVTNMGYIFFGGLGFAIPVDYVKHFISNREAFAFDKDNANTGYRYIQPCRRLKKDKPEMAAFSKK